MTTEVRWRCSLSATCMHAAWCRRIGVPAADSGLADILDVASDSLIASISSAGWPVEAALTDFAGLATEYENNEELVERVAARVSRGVDSERYGSPRVAGAITELEASVHRALPNIKAELDLRVRPIREQWEAHGPGLLHAVAALTEDLVIPECAEVVLVGPYVGGHGLAHLRTNRVLLEAVLVHPNPALPETLRLAWMLCQLNADLPVYADLLGARLTSVIEFAMIPVVLTAASELGISEIHETLVAEAVSTWCMRSPFGDGAHEQLWKWWKAYEGSRVRWPIALKSLTEMLAR